MNPNPIDIHDFAIQHALLELSDSESDFLLASVRRLNTLIHVNGAEAELVAEMGFLREWLERTGHLVLASEFNAMARKVEASRRCRLAP